MEKQDVIISSHIPQILRNTGRKPKKPINECCVKLERIWLTLKYFLNALY